MKRFVVLILFSLFLASFAIGFTQQLFVGERHDLVWDEVTTPPFATVSYELCVVGSMDPEEVHYILGEVLSPPYAADISTFDFEVNFGIRTVWTFTADWEVNDIQYYVGQRLESDWNYSDVNGVYTPNPFVGLRGVLAPTGFERIP